MDLDWKQYRPAEGTVILSTIDAHAAGEPLRIITGGLPPLQGATILERRRFMQEHYDHLRKALMWEPRGHFHMYGAVLTPPVTPEADLGVLFLHNEGYSTMCGHGIIALVTTLVKTGAISPQGPHTPVTLDTPAGLVRATAHLDSSGQVERVSFLNVPSFVYAHEVELDLPTYGKLAVDIAFGGAFYAILPAERVGLRVAPEATAQLVAAGSAIKKAVNARLSITHPFEEDLGFLYGTILTDAPQDPTHHSRNICVFANDEVDRSPTGTGVSARLALHAARGEVADDQPVVIESLLGEMHTFSGRVAGRAAVGPFEAIIPEVSGTAFLTGRHEFLIEAADLLGQGFLLP
ncbi:proline racemase family protein [Ktedonospora formicarum]|uniref:Proline racemase n=1 Tax=Ktedonospora formicarum TaxID=2778364 RepID=A0A8J3I870_9CHLR|nr:proline racemase family protein [Ktedonospora formicarum]GHO48968.1 proline racemase [Ktedonospora formicarum]